MWAIVPAGGRVRVAVLLFRRGVEVGRLRLHARIRLSVVRLYRRLLPLTSSVHERPPALPALHAHSAMTQPALPQEEGGGRRGEGNERGRSAGKVDRPSHWQPETQPCRFHAGDAESTGLTLVAECVLTFDHNMLGGGKSSSFRSRGNRGGLVCRRAIHDELQQLMLVEEP